MVTNKFQKGYIFFLEITEGNLFMLLPCVVTFVIVEMGWIREQVDSVKSIQFRTFATQAISLGHLSLHIFMFFVRDL